MIQDLLMGRKLGLAIGGLIGLTALLGIVALGGMVSVSRTTTQLEEEFVPQVTLAVELERDLSTAMYNMVAFTYTRDAQNFQIVKEHLDDFEQVVQKASTLSERAAHLTKLSSTLKELDEHFKSYRALTTRTHEIVQKLTTLDATLETDSQSMVDFTARVIDRQNTSLNDELKSGKPVAERLRKLVLLNKIIDSANALVVEAPRLKPKRYT
jgi:methyl-accepting chemotaxis protein